MVHLDLEHPRRCPDLKGLTTQVAYNNKTIIIKMVSHSVHSIFLDDKTSVANGYTMESINAKLSRNEKFEYPM